MTSFINRAAATAGLAAALALTAVAQTPAPQAGQESPGQHPHREGRMGRHGKHGFGGRHGGEHRLLRRLNLSDAQREQLRAIEQRYAQDFRAQREELRALAQQRRQNGGTLAPEQQARAEALRKELRESAERMRGEIQNVLTPEQREQLKQQREEFKQRREEFKQRREELRRQRQAAPPSTNE